MQSLLSLALSNAIMATCLAALAAMIAPFCRRPSVRHALWLLVLLKLITPPIVTLSIPCPPSEERQPPSTESPSPALDLPSLPEPSEARYSLTDATESAAASPVQTPTVPLTFAEMGMSLALAVWLAGSFGWWMLASLRLWKFRCLLRRACPAPADVQQQARRLAAILGVRHCPPVLFTSAPLSPMLWALGFSPRLLVPAELWRKLSAEQQDTLLAHELAHLRRGDHWVRRLEFVVLGLYWWHPVVWWARRRLQEAEEECCDALVVAVLPDAVSAYASALVETVAFLSQCRASALVGASGAGQVPLLKRRLTMILMANPSRRPARLAFWIVLILGALLLPLAPRAARTEAPEEPAPKESPRQESAKRQPVATERDRGEEIEKLQDEIELLKLKVQLKDARRPGTQTKLKEVQRRLNIMLATNRKNPGTIPFDTIADVRMTEAGLTADAAVQEIEWKEATLLLKQAERRLARLQHPAEKTDGGGRAEQEKRLRELEQKVENLLKEIHRLRKEIQPDKPRVPRRTSAIPSEQDWIWKNVGLHLRSLGAPIKASGGEFRGGLVVEAIRAMSPFWGSGLIKGDILVGLHKYEVMHNKDVQYILTRPELSPSQQLKFYYLRGGKLESGQFELGK